MSKGINLIGHFTIVKGTVYIVLLLVVALQCKGQSVVIEGRVVSNSGNAIIWFKRQLLPNQEFKVIDSVSLGYSSVFSFKFPKLDPGYYQLYYKDDETFVANPVLIDHGPYALNVIVDTTSFPVRSGRVRGRKIIIKGSNDNDLLNQYFELRRDFYTNKIFPTEEKMRIANSTNRYDLLDSLNNALRTYRTKMFERLSNFLLRNMGTSIAVYQTMNTWDNSQHKFMLAVMEKFRDERQSSFILPFMEEKYKQLVRTSLLQRPAPIATLKDSDGNAVKLEDYFGKKTVLLDFWASWCGPCIKEMRGYRDALENIEKQGIFVISVSIDKRPDDWRKSLSTNKFPWVQLIDEGGTMAKQYGVLQLPTNFLINKEGIIIEKNVTLMDLLR